MVETSCREPKYLQRLSSFSLNSHNGGGRRGAKKKDRGQPVLGCAMMNVDVSRATTE